MLEIVREFASCLPERSRELQTKLEADDREGLQTMAHQLKGAGGGYGFQQITDAAATLEQALRDDAGGAAIKDHCLQLCQVLDAVEVSEES